MYWMTNPVASRGAAFCYDAVMAKLVLDLHEIFRDGKAISQELGRVIDDAVSKRISLVEIIPGKGSGQLKRKVIRFLDQPHIKSKYHRIERDAKNHGRIFVHFRHDSPYKKR